MGVGVGVGVMVTVGLYCRRHATDVNGFVLGGRSVGPWLTAFAYGTSYFSAVVFVGYAGQFGWKSGIAAEVIGIPDGSIGEMLYQAKAYLNTVDLFAWTVVIVAVSLAFEKSFLALLLRIYGRVIRL